MDIFSFNPLFSVARNVPQLVLTTDFTINEKYQVCGQYKYFTEPTNQLI